MINKKKHPRLHSNFHCTSKKHVSFKIPYALHHFNFCHHNDQQTDRYLSKALLLHHHHASWTCRAALQQLSGGNCRDDSLAEPHFPDRTLSPAFTEANAALRERHWFKELSINVYATAPANREKAGSSKKIIRSLELSALQAIVTMKR